MRACLSKLISSQTIYKIISMEIKKNRIRETNKNIPAIPTERIGEKRISNRMVLLFFSLSFSVAIMFIFLIPKYEETKIKEIEIELIQKTLESKRDIFIKITSFNRTYRDISETEINKMYNLLPDENMTHLYH